MSYARLPIIEFGTSLIRTEDLDPVYGALRRTKWDAPKRDRWLLAYWCFYDCGVASYLSEFHGMEFWQVLMRAAVNETPSPLGGRWRRAAERRHARGLAAVKMVSSLQERYGECPEYAVQYMAKGWTPTMGSDLEPQTCAKVMKRVKEHHLFGDWIAFKVADMADRVMGVPVNFDEGHIFMFKDPVKAALMVWRSEMKLPENAEPRELNPVLHGVVTYLTDQFSTLKAPPDFERPIAVQEVETVLCKWKSHLNGHYPLLNDINEIEHGLKEWVPLCDAAAQLISVWPDGHCTQ
jgi:hypothetical protein